MIWSLIQKQVPLLIGVSLLLVNTAKRQAALIKLLKAQLRVSQPDSIRSQLYLRLGDAYLPNRLDSAQYFILKSVALAKREANWRLLSRG